MSGLAPKRADRGRARMMVAAALVLLSPVLGRPTAPETPSPPLATVSLDELMQLLAQRRHGEADFTEVRSLSVLSEPLRSSGVLIFDAPDHLEQRILQPRPQTVVLDHGVLTMHRGKRERSVSLTAQPHIAPLVDSIRALLAGERATLEQHFELQLTGVLAHWSLRLEPREAALASSVREIDISGERDAIREVQLQARNGDHTVMHIQPRS